MTAQSTENATVRLQRTIAAPPDRVYRAWLDPELLKRWLAPGSMTAPRVEVDERPGGRFAVWHSDDSGDVGGMESEIVELVPNERLDFVWRFVGPDREADPGLDSRLTITLREVPDGTELTLVHERLEALGTAMPHVGERVSEGWGMVLDKLESLLGA
jgi:uncharacterized protein YndB with AHSA1/START domain